MAYSADTFVADEQPTTAKWNKLWSNDAAFNDGSGFANGALGSVNASLAAGIVCQVVGNTTGAVATGTTTIPQDDTIPQITEGTEFMTQAITPKATTNKLLIEVNAFVTHSVASVALQGALFQDSTANGLAACQQYMATGTGRVILMLRHIMTAGTTSSTTFRFRAGGEVAGTMTFNGISGNRFYGGVSLSSITITEYKA